jgi:hypothetical protein
MRYPHVADASYGRQNKNKNKRTRDVGHSVDSFGDLIEIPEQV